MPLPFEPDTVILLYSDGVTEAPGPERDELFGLERLKESLARYAGEDVETLVNGILRDVQDFTGTLPQYDDITLVAIRRTEE